MARLVIVLVIVLQCNLLWAIKPLPEGLAVETEPVEEGVIEAELKEEPPPPEIQKAIEKEKQEREEVIQKRDQELEKPKELVKKPKPIKPIPVPKIRTKGLSLSVIITALVLLLISFFIYRKR